MTKYRLVLYDQISRRMVWRLVLLLIAMVLVGVYDRINSYLGNLWLAWWVAIFLVAGMVAYYGLFYRRAAIEVGSEGLRLKGVMKFYDIPLNQINSAATSTLEQHFPWNELTSYEKKLFKTNYYQTCVFIELQSYPEEFNNRRLWFPRILFSPTRPGLICHVDDWMALSSQVDKIRVHREDERHRAHISDRRTLVGRILAEELEFN